MTFPELVSEHPCIISFLGTDLLVEDDERTKWEGTITFETSVRVAINCDLGFVAVLSIRGSEVAMGHDSTPQGALTHLASEMEEQLNCLSALVYEPKTYR